jgi:hypothetical protein
MPRLARANVCGLAATAWLILAVGWGSARAAATLRPVFGTATSAAEARALCASVLLAGAGAYALFLVAFPETQRGDTIKASHLLHLYPLAALFGAGLLEALHARTPALARAVALAVALGLLANAPLHRSAYAPFSGQVEDRFRSIEARATRLHEIHQRRGSADRTALP